MTPVKYKSKWSCVMFLVAFLGRTGKTLSVVADGQQPESGLIMLDMKEAKAWLRENGYEQVN